MQVYVSISFLLQYTLFSFLFDLEVCQSAVLKQNVKNSPASIDPIVESCGLKELFLSRPHRRRVFNSNPSINAIASQPPHNFTTVRLFGKTHVFLQVTNDGTVKGTSQCNSGYSKKWFVNAVVFSVSNCQLQENLSFYSIIAGFQLFKGTEFRTWV